MWNLIKMMQKGTFFDNNKKKIFENSRLASALRLSLWGWAKHLIIIQHHWLRLNPEKVQEKEVMVESQAGKAHTLHMGRG